MGAEIVREGTGDQSEAQWLGIDKEGMVSMETYQEKEQTIDRHTRTRRVS